MFEVGRQVLHHSLELLLELVPATFWEPDRDRHVVRPDVRSDHLTWMASRSPPEDVPVARERHDHLDTDGSLPRTADSCDLIMEVALHRRQDENRRFDPIPLAQILDQVLLAIRDDALVAAIE